MYRRLLLFAAGMVLLAGCAAGPDATPTANPSPTGSATPTATGPLAPGITDDGITNPVALMSAHQVALLTDGFVAEQTVESTYGGAVSNRMVMRTTVGPGGELALQNGTSTAPEADASESAISNDIWLNTTAQVSRHVEDGVTTYQVRPRLYPPESLVWFGTLQRDIQFAAAEYAVSAVETRDGVRYVTLSVSSDRVGNDGVDDAVGRLVVDERGVIHRAEMAVTYDEGTVYRTTYTVRELGGVRPMPPAWLDAVPPSAALTVGLDVFDFDEQRVELIHTHGDAVPAGSIVAVVSNGTLYETTLEAPFAEGARYLWLADDGTLRATAAPPVPDDAQPLATEITVTVHAPDGGRLFSTSIGRQ